MSSVIWINPVVRGSCTPEGGCGSACCMFQVYTDSVNYTMEWCKHYNQDPEVTLKCMIYENRYEGCKIYPSEPRFFLHTPKCGYYLEEEAQKL